MESCRRSRRAIERLFVAGLSGEQQNRLLDHVRGCDACNREYLRRLAVERAAVHGEADRPTHFEVERLGQRILARAAPVDEPKPRRWLSRPVAWAAAAVVVLLALSTPLLWQRLTNPWEELTPKGSHAPPAVGLRVLRLHRGPDGRGLDQPLPPLRPDAPARLRGDDSLVLLYTNRGPARHAFVLGVDDAWRPLWYFPAPPRRRSVRIEAGAADRPFGPPIRLRVNHRPGRLTILGLFSERPLEMDRVKKLLERARRSGAQPAKTDLPLGEDVQTLRIELLVQGD